MALTRGFIRNAVTTPLDARLMDMSQIVGNSNGSARPGVLDGDGRVLLTALATMHVAVAVADFVTSKSAADGVAIFTNDGVVNVPISAAPASNSRYTIIWVRHQDSTTGDGASTPIFGTSDGAASAGPIEPAIPTGALRLGVLRVWAGTTAANGGANSLVNDYPMTASRGGMVVVRNAIERNAWTNPQRGQRLYQMDTNRIYMWVITTGAPAGAWMPERAAFFANRVNAQALPAVGWYGLGPSFGAASINDIGVWAGAPNGTLQIQHAGVYRLGFNVKLSVPSNPFAMQITNNSTAPDVNVLVESFLNSAASAQSAQGLATLAVGDVLRALVYTSAVGAISVAQLSAELVAFS